MEKESEATMKSQVHLFGSDYREPELKDLGSSDISNIEHYDFLPSTRTPD